MEFMRVLPRLEVGPRRKNTYGFVRRPEGLINNLADRMAPFCVTISVSAIKAEVRFELCVFELWFALEN